ncbi:MAG: hypothetical protein WAM14_10490 [Candidatus Nitrosopolaris sp.]
MTLIEYLCGCMIDIDKTRSVHYICDKLKQGTPIRSLLLATGKVDTVYA